jgi:hypothetical protein
VALRFRLVGSVFAALPDITADANNIPHKDLLDFHNDYKLNSGYRFKSMITTAITTTSKASKSINAIAPMISHKR